MTAIGVARHRDGHARSPDPIDHLLALFVRRRPAELVEQISRCRIRVDRANFPQIEGVAEEQRPTLLEGAKRRLGPVQRPLGIDPSRLGELSRGLDPVVPDRARVGRDTVPSEQRTDRRNERPFIEIDECTVAVEGDCPNLREIDAR